MERVGYFPNGGVGSYWRFTNRKTGDVCATLSCELIGETVATEDLHIQDGIIIPGHELEFQASLSGGPGGQHVNKTHSRITLRWHLESSEALSDSQRAYLLTRIAGRITNAGFVVVHCDAHRSQRRNMEGAREQFKELIYNGLQRPKKRRPTKPTKASQRIRVDNKKKRGDLKHTRRKPGLD